MFALKMVHLVAICVIACIMLKSTGAIPIPEQNLFWQSGNQIQNIEFRIATSFAQVPVNPSETCPNDHIMIGGHCEPIQKQYQQ